MGLGKRVGRGARRLGVSPLNPTPRLPAPPLLSYPCPLAGNPRVTAGSGRALPEVLPSSAGDLLVASTVILRLEDVVEHQDTDADRGDAHTEEEHELRQCHRGTTYPVWA